MLAPPSLPHRTTIASVALALATSLATPALRADDALDQAAAEAAFGEGLALLEKGDAAGACPKLEAAVALTKGEALGGKLALARCYEAMGKLASAWALYSEVAARATTAGQSERALEARKGADALATRVPKLRVVLSPALEATPGLTLRRGGKDVPREAWATALPVDPGRVELELRGDAGRATLTVEALVGTTVEARFEALTPDPVAPTAPTATATTPAARASAPEAATPPTTQPDTGRGDGQRIAGVVVGATGLGAVAVSTILAVVAKGDYDDAFADGGCADEGGTIRCDDVGGVDSARGLGTAATVVGGVGLGLAAAGIVLYLVAPSDPPSTASLRPVILASERGGFVGLEGSF